MERLLEQLPGACSVGEVHNLWERGLDRDEPCGCGQQFARCDFWTAVGDRAFGGWRNVDLPRVLALKRAIERFRLIPRLARPRLPAPALAAVAEYAGYYTRLYAAAATLTGSSVVIDSSKAAPLAYALRWVAGLDLRVVHLVRDPRGVSYSQTKQRPRLPGHQPQVLMRRYSPARTALDWNLCNAPFDLLGRLAGARGGGPPVPVPVRRVWYENLLADPPGVVGELAGFAGLEMGPDDLSYLADGHAELGQTHNPSGNPMRFDHGRIELRLDQTWRSALPRRQRWLVGASCAPLMMAYRRPPVVPAAPGDPDTAAAPAPHSAPAPHAAPAQPAAPEMSASPPQSGFPPGTVTAPVSRST